MPKQLQSKTQIQIQKSIKNIETFDLPINTTIQPQFETRDEWLEEMAQEEAQMTPEQKQEVEQQGHAQLERMRKLDAYVAERSKKNPKFSQIVEQENINLEVAVKVHDL